MLNMRYKRKHFYCYMPCPTPSAQSTDGGSQRFPSLNGTENPFLRSSTTRRDNWNSVNLDTFTGRSVSGVQVDRGFPSSPSGYEEPISSPLDRMRPSSTSGSLRPESENHLSWERSQYQETQRQTGTESSSWQGQENMIAFPETFLFVIMSTSRRSLLTILGQLGSLRSVSSFGEPQGLARADRHGMRREYVVTLRTRTLNGGAATRVRATLSLMNFEEQFRFRIYLDGSIATQSLWRRKEEPLLLGPNGSGSLPTYIPEIGTLDLTVRR